MTHVCTNCNEKFEVEFIAVDPRRLSVDPRQGKNMVLVAGTWIQRPLCPACDSLGDELEESCDQMK